VQEGKITFVCTICSSLLANRDLNFDRTFNDMVPRFLGKHVQQFGLTFVRASSVQGHAVRLVY
jgi:hypothetical protein